MKTRSIKQNEINEKWYMIDIAGKRLGLVAQRIAEALIGKNEVTNAAYLEPKNKVVVINSDKIDFYPQRAWRKKYYSHSGYPGGFKEATLAEMMKKDSRKVIRQAVKGMLPKNKRGRKMLSNLKIYNDENYLETAQQPIKIT